MRYFLLRILFTLLGVVLGVMAFFIVAPRVDWAAAQRPGGIEETVAASIISRWVAHGARGAADPITPTLKNLDSERDEYNEHCAPCHALDGSGHDQFEADFLPRVPPLTGHVQDLSDSELYSVVAHGIRNTAMPTFGSSPPPRRDLEDYFMGAPPRAIDPRGP